jgi:SWI/SNF-related matrix-associated actin-dependent regulator 1 of chromatin subfamily A
VPAPSPSAQHFVSASSAQAYLRSRRLPLSALFAAAKLAHLAATLPALVAAGHRVLVFSQWTTILDLLQDACDALRVRATRLDGSTPVAERQRLIDAFDAGGEGGGRAAGGRAAAAPYLPVFLLSTRAGGLGLNLTAADTVVLFDSDLNPHVDAQAVDRAHRIGQTKPVRVLRLVTAATADETVVAIAARKTHLDEALRLSSPAARRAAAGGAAGADADADADAGADAGADADGAGAEPRGTSVAAMLLSALLGAADGGAAAAAAR